MTNLVRTEGHISRLELLRLLDETRDQTDTIGRRVTFSQAPDMREAVAFTETLRDCLAEFERYCVYARLAEKLEDCWNGRVADVRQLVRRET